jgi:ribonuclease BN (tRNA processing enzyme)
MRLTLLGGCGAWPEAGQACSGFLVEHDGFRLLVDLGYATVPRLLEVLRRSRPTRRSSATGIPTTAPT